MTPTLGAHFSGFRNGWVEQSSAPCSASDSHWAWMPRVTRPSVDTGALSKVAEQLLTLINWESTPTTEREDWVAVRARSVNALVQASETTTKCRREPSANTALRDRTD